MEAMYGESQSSEEWLKSHSIEHQGLALKNLVDRGKIARSVGQICYHFHQILGAKMKLASTRKGVDRCVLHNFLLFPGPKETWTVEKPSSTSSLRQRTSTSMNTVSTCELFDIRALNNCTVVQSNTVCIEKLNKISFVFHCRAIELYTKRIKWLLQGSRRVGSDKTSFVQSGWRGNKIEN